MIKQLERLMPQPVTDKELSFGLLSVTKHLPQFREIPAEFTRNNWFKIAEYWYHHGLTPGCSYELHEGIDKLTAIRHIEALIATTNCKHTQRLAGMALLMSLWFKQITIPMKPIR